MDDFETQVAHRRFAAECFNAVWALIEKTGRTPEEAEEMVHLAHTSLWHWTQCDSHSDTNLAIGYWQISRVYALIGEADNATKYGERCLAISRRSGVPPFYQAYAYEALSRAAWVGGDTEQASAYKAEATRLANQVEKTSERGLILSDLAQIGNNSSA